MNKYVKDILKDGTKIYGKIKKNYCLVSSKDDKQKFVCIYDTDEISNDVLKSSGYYIADFASDSYPYFVNTPFGRILGISRMVFNSESEMLKKFKYC